MKPFLPYSRQNIEQDDVDAVVAALRSDFLTTGPRVREFEISFANVTGASEAIACNSGTAALHLSVLALGMGPGDTVIVPTVTFLATANVNRMVGAEVFFADVDGETGLMTAETLEHAAVVSKQKGMRPKLALPVHLNGAICDLPAIAEVASRHDIDVVEDACHALGVEAVGATRYSRAINFSTHAVKNAATGEGGVVTTDDPYLAVRMRRFRDHGIVRDAGDFEDRNLSFSENEPNPWSYEMPEVGWNYRIPDILCALGQSQIAKLQTSMARRNVLAALYRDLLAPLAPVINPVPESGRPHGRHLFPVLLDFTALGTTRARVMRELRNQGIGTQVHYIPVHRQPYYKNRYGERVLPGAERYYSRCLSIPFFPGMMDEDAARVVQALTAIANH